MGRGYLLVCAAIKHILPSMVTTSGTHRANSVSPFRPWLIPGYILPRALFLVVQVVELIIVHPLKGLFDHVIASGVGDEVNRQCFAVGRMSHDPETGHTFEAWFKRWEDVFQTDFSCQDDAWKVCLLVRKLRITEHSRFVDHILPKLSRDLKFDEALAQSSEIFGESASLFRIQYNCLKSNKRNGEDYGMLADRVDRDCERFKLCSLTNDQFKCLIFIRALQNLEDADILIRLLSRLDQDSDMNLKILMTEYKRLISLKHDTALVEQNTSIADIHAMH
ncbi:unnamed protein product [Echinostoma caproni]|uniref:DUF7083 domain-containing protein n=1 Tax=Echinostoma caproni TaxID=27848 RepID=A0A183B4K1_9TREM|nr:unnamed protein product [Echinostoma caproni]